MAVSPTQLRFTGTGHYNASTADTRAISGTISGDHVTFKITLRPRLPPRARTP